MASPIAAVPRYLLPIGLDPELGGTLARRADGRVLVIDAFRSWQCGTWVGDVSVEWRRAAPDDEYVPLEPIESVRVFAHRRLLGLLRRAGPTLVSGRIPFLGGLGVTLERPELWIDWLEHPGSFADELPSEKNERSDVENAAVEPG